MISNSPSPPTQCWFVEINNCQIQEPYSRIIPSEAPTLNSGGRGFIFDSGYNFFAVSFKKCLPGDNCRRLSQLLLTRIVAPKNIQPLK